MCCCTDAFGLHIDSERIDRFYLEMAYFEGFAIRSSAVSIQNAIALVYGHFPFSLG